MEPRLQTLHCVGVAIARLRRLARRGCWSMPREAHSNSALTHVYNSCQQQCKMTHPAPACAGGPARQRPERLRRQSARRRASQQRATTPVAAEALSVVIPPSASLSPSTQHCKHCQTRIDAASHCLGEHSASAHAQSIHPSPRGRAARAAAHARPVWAARTQRTAHTGLVPQLHPSGRRP